VEEPDYYDVIPALRITEVQLRLRAELISREQPGLPGGASLAALTDFGIRCKQREG
jgi:hypothetical protein